MGFFWGVGRVVLCCFVPVLCHTMSSLHCFPCWMGVSLSWSTIPRCSMFCLVNRLGQMSTIYMQSLMEYWRGHISFASQIQQLFCNAAYPEQMCSLPSRFLHTARAIDCMTSNVITGDYYLLWLVLLEIRKLPVFEWTLQSTLMHNEVCFVVIVLVIGQCGHTYMVILWVLVCTLVLTLNPDFLLHALNFFDMAC